MREKKNFAQRSKVLASAEARKKYFLVYEGEETEQIYFDAVNEQKDSLGINPLIEQVPVWLLLHFDEVMNLDMEQLLENPKVTSKRRYTEQQLRTLMPGFTKAKYDVNTLMQRIDKAISNEKQFCEDDQELEHTVGSKVGLKEVKRQMR